MEYYISAHRDISIWYEDSSDNLSVQLILIYFDEVNLYHLDYTINRDGQAENYISQNNTNSKAIHKTYVGSELYYFYEDMLVTSEEVIEVVATFLKNGEKGKSISWVKYFEAKFPPKPDL